MEKENYYYPDVDDKAITAFIAENEPFEGYWQKSERYFLNVMKKYVQNYTVNKADTVFLDAGCGTGRLLVEFEKYFDHILAIDPDPIRIDVAKNISEKQGFADKTIFQSIPIEKFNWKEGVDVILCSHVLQHVHTDSVPLILRKFYHLMREGGLLFTTTCHSRRNNDYYAKAYLKNSQVIEEIIEKEEFNALIFNNNNILPLHFFSRKNLMRQIANLNFRILDFRSFHILGKIPAIDRILNRDLIVNSLHFLQTRLGRDMFIVARKMTQTNKNLLHLCSVQKK